MGLSKETNRYPPSCREEVFSETSSPRLCTVLHVYSACATSGSKLKWRECQSRRLGGQQAAEDGHRGATVVVVPLGCVCFYATR